MADKMEVIMREMYRSTSLGATLKCAIEDLVKKEDLPKDIDTDIMEVYDDVVSTVLLPSLKSRVNFHGTLGTYRFCDNEWNMRFKNFNLREGQSVHQCEFMKVVACSDKTKRSRMNTGSKHSKKIKVGGKK
ncbi:hypothetical protein ACOME3_008630 [Neoechinorhynchus agilis]